VKIGIQGALHKSGDGAAVKTNHESTKGRKHEKEFPFTRFSFVLSSFRAFVMGVFGQSRIQGYLREIGVAGKEMGLEGERRT
jgi:hypothetical protein